MAGSSNSMNRKMRKGAGSKSMNEDPTDAFLFALRQENGLVVSHYLFLEVDSCIVISSYCSQRDLCPLSYVIP